MNRSELYKRGVRRVTRLLLAWVCTYLYVGVVVTLAFEDFPIAVVHVVAVLALVVLCWYVVRAGHRDGSNVGPGPELGTVFILRFTAVALVCTSLSVAVGVATASALDEELRREVLAPVTTCERSSSGIANLAVGETIRAPGATITVENVTYGVPQQSKRPQPYAYECQQATLVEVVIEPADDPQGIGGNLDIYAFEVRTKDGGRANADGSPDEFTSHARREGLELIERSSFGDDGGGGTIRGWMVFPMVDTASSSGQVFAYEPQLGDVEETVALPE